MTRCCSAFITFVVLCSGQTPNFRIDRVAGLRLNPAVPVFAREALLSIPYGITTDRIGNVYFHDRNNYVIRKLSTAGIITVFAGNGEVGNTGDGGPALAARINEDVGNLTIGPDGSLYFVDGWNCTVRRVTPAGQMERVAGMPSQCGFSGDGGSATAARLSILGTITLDAAGNLYIGDGLNNRIRRVRTDGIIETFAGTGTAGFTGDGGPANLAQLSLPSAFADGKGGFWILDAGNYRIRRISSDGTISTVAGNGRPGVTPDNGPALTSSLGFITYAAAHPNGSLYFSDRATHKMYALTPEGAIRRVVGTGRLGFAGDGVAGELADVKNTDDLNVAPDGSVVFSDQLNEVIRRLTPAGTVEIIAGRQRFSGDYGAAWEQVLNGPVGVAWDTDGSYYIYEQFGQRIRKVDVDGTMITVAGNGEPGIAGDGNLARHAQTGMVSGPANAALAVDTQHRVYLVDADSSRVRRFLPGDRMEAFAGSGVRGFAGDNGAVTEAQFDGPSGIAIAKDGQVFISDTNNNRIRVVDNLGRIRTIAGTGVRGFAGDDGPATEARLSLPGSLSLDSAGNLYFLDVGNSRIRRISTTGLISTVAGNGAVAAFRDGPEKEIPLFSLKSLAVTPEGGLLFAESTSTFPFARLRYIGTDGMVTTLNGGTTGYKGEGEPLSRAAFSSIQQISVNSSGEVLIADRDNHVIRELTAQPLVK